MSTVPRNDSCRPRVLVIAGVDSSGGAGLVADREAADAAGADVVCVTTAHTVQSDAGLVELGARAASEWLEEARRIVRAAAWPEIGDQQDEGLAEAKHISAATPFGAIKFGLLPGLEHVRAAEQLVTEVRALAPMMPVVLDPVLGPTSGGRFLDEEGVAQLCAWAARGALVLTPNLPEACELMRASESDGALALMRGSEWSGASGSIEERETLGEGESTGACDSVDAMVSIDISASDTTRVDAVPDDRDDAHQLANPEEWITRVPRSECGTVLLKGGHGAGDPMRDLLLVPGGAVHAFEHSRHPSTGIRGSGCRLATRLAVELARGCRMSEATAVAIGYISGLIVSSIQTPE
ncbi:MAG: hydroxymethylpyrimidine/phosphomethylpyrimidine kinase [Planctomycetota bacterium]